MTTKNARRAVLPLLAAMTLAIGPYGGTPALATSPSGQTTDYVLAPLPNNRSIFEEIQIKAKTDIAPGNPTDFWQARIDTKGESDLYVVKNTFVVGGYTGWHSHPGPSLVTVTQGTITAYDGDDPTCTPHVYPAGSTFIDPTSAGHLHFLRNEGTEAAITVAVQLVPTGVNRRLEADDPGYCHFGP
jgi:quercetin dioxygenase-like cupin family protein